MYILRRTAVYVSAVLWALSAKPALAFVYLWSAGPFSNNFSGVQTISSADVLVINSLSGKILDVPLTNFGSISDFDSFLLISDLTNQGRFSIDGNAGLNSPSASFVNKALFEKTGAAGSNSIISADFKNSGGILLLDGGTSLTLTRNSEFSAGSVIQGYGKLILNGISGFNTATFDGVFSDTNNLTLAGGTLKGGGDNHSFARLISGGLEWTGGNIRGTLNLEFTTQLNVDTGNIKELQGTLTNQGVATVNDNLGFFNGSFNNEGRFKAVGNTDLQVNLGTGKFINSGLFEKSGTAGSHTTVSVDFSNAGNGIVQVDSGTTLTLTGHNNFADGSVITGSGKLILDQGISVASSTTFTGNFTDNANLVLAGGTLTGGDNTIGSSDATLSKGSLDWTGGTINGTLNLAAGTRLDINGPGVKTLSGNLTNSGIVTVNESLFFSNGTFDNEHQFTVADNNDLAVRNGTGGFINNGVFEKSGAAGSSTNIFAAFNNLNKGTVQVDNGTVLILRNNNNFADGSTITGSGKLIINGTGTFDGTFSDNRNLILAGGTLIAGANPDPNVASARLVRGSLDWTGGTVKGTLNFGSGTLLNVSGGDTKVLSGQLTNFGTAKVTDSVLFLGGTLSNLNQFHITGGADLGAQGSSGTFNNLGLFEKNGSGITHVSSIELSNAAGGTIDVKAGTLQFDTGFTNHGVVRVEAGANLAIGNASVFSTAGVIEGEGNVVGDVDNQGTIRPGLLGAAGNLIITGNYTQESSGIFEEQLGSSFSLLTINGDAVFNGNLYLKALAGLKLSVDDNIVIASIAGQLYSGYFGGQTLFTDTLGDKFRLGQNVDNGITTLNLTVLEVAPVPLPSPVGLFGFGLIAWCSLTRKALKAGMAHLYSEA